MNSTQGTRIGKTVPGYEVRVINERAVRVAAALLFLGGALAFAAVLFIGTAQPLKPFGMYFMMDMLIRLTVGDRWSPTMALGRIAVRQRKPLWVGAPQKEFAWWFGFGLALVSCTSMGLFAAPLWVTLMLCSVCLTLLFLETAFGICLSCSLYKHVSKQEPQYCPRGSCPV